jgi:hypothetical protein
MPRGNQPKGRGKGQPRQQHPKDQPKGCGAGPRHQQDKRRRRLRPRPPQAAPEQLGAAASTGDAAKTGEAQVAQERASQELDRTQRAALLNLSEKLQLGMYTEEPLLRWLKDFCRTAAPY